MDNILSSEMAIAEIEKLQTRKSELDTSMAEKRTLFESADVDTRDALLKEVEEMKNEFDSIDGKIADLEILRDKYKEQEERMSLMENVKNVEVVKKEDYRSTTQYADMWQRYVLSNDDREIRAFTTSVTADTGVSNGGVVVPTIMQQYVETAWEEFPVLNAVSVSNIAGYFSVPIEVEADEASWHIENGDPVAEEDVVLANVLLQPLMIKKFVAWTDELEAMTSATFMEYIRDEVVYRVLKKLADAIFTGTLSSGKGVLGITSDLYNASSNVKGAQVVDGAITFNSVNSAIAKLSTFDNLAVYMNQATFFDTIMGMTDLQGRPIFQISTDNAGRPRYFVNGIPVYFCNALPAYSADLTANTPYAVVGNFRGYKLNLPEGRSVITLVDPYTLATSDKKRLISRIFAAGAITRIGHFAVLRTASE